MPTTINPSDQTITQYNVQTGGASNLLNNVVPTSTVGVPFISQGAASQPVFGTALVAGGGTGAIALTGVLTGNGTSAVTANAVTNHGVLLGDASNAVSSLGVASTGTVLIGNTGIDPSFSATPAITSLNFGVSNLSAYVEGTFTPTIDGSTPGTTNYNSQNGYYTKIGNVVFVYGTIDLSSATGTVNATIGALPFTVKIQTNGIPQGSIIFSASGWTWAAARTTMTMRFIANSQTALINISKSLATSANLQMTNAAAVITFAGYYQI